MVWGGEGNVARSRASQPAEAYERSDDCRGFGRADLIAETFCRAGCGWAKTRPDVVTANYDSDSLVTTSGLDSGPQWFAFGGKSGSVRRRFVCA